MSEQANGKLKEIYKHLSAPGRPVDHMLTTHSLQPHTLEGHMPLYKNVPHHSNNTLPKWFLETIGIYMSLLNHCLYCVVHHYTGLLKLLPIDAH